MPERVSGSLVAVRSSRVPQHEARDDVRRAESRRIAGSVPVLVLDEGMGAQATARTLASLSRQTIATRMVPSLASDGAIDTPFVVLVLAGTVLDVTACERAIWFLSTHADRTCVTGGVEGHDAPMTPLLCAAQFLVVRTDAAVRVLAATPTPKPALAVALAVGLYRECGRGAGWVAQPLIHEPVASDVLSPIANDALQALRALGLDSTLLVDVDSNRVSRLPLQWLSRSAPPQLPVRLAPATGLRILLLVQGFPMGGYTAVNVDLVPRLAAAGHVITSCATEIWRSDWRLDRIRAAAPDIHHPHATVPADSVPAYIDSLITSREIDVVLMSHSHLAYHLLPFLRSRHPRVAFVDWVHTDWFEDGMYGSYSTMAAQWTGELDAQLTTSHALRQHLLSEGCAEDAVETAYIGIDTALWLRSGARHAEIRASIGATDDTLVLLFSGRLSPEKRPHLAVDVLAGLCAEGHDVHLLMVGEGPLSQDTLQRAHAAGVGDRCKLLGELDEYTLRHVYAAADVLLAPSTIEGISRSVYEAMSMECVPVVSDVGGQRELVAAGTGSLVLADGDDAAPYLEAMRTWLDPAARRQAGAAARARIVARFDSGATVRSITAALTRAQVRRRSRQAVVPAPIADSLAVLSLEVTRRHVLRAMGR